MHAVHRKMLPPMLNGGLPFLGYAFEFRNDPIGLLTRGQEEFGDIFSFLMAGNEVTVLTGSQGNEAFFEASGDSLSTKESYQFTIPVFGKGMAYHVGPEPDPDHLHLLLPAIHDQRLQSYARLMACDTIDYLYKWGDRGDIDLPEFANELVFYTASRCLAGDEFQRNFSVELGQLCRNFESGPNLMAFIQPNFPLPSVLRRKSARARLNQMIKKTIAVRRARGIPGLDFLQTLLEARNSDGTPLPDSAIAELLTQIFLDLHNNAALAAWTGILLLQHQHYLREIMEEQQEVFTNGSDMSLEYLWKLNALERAIKEAERLRPPLAILARRIVSYFDFRGYRAQAGGLVMVSPALSHRLGELFCDPDMYDPRRFGPYRDEDGENSHKLIGFGGGLQRDICRTFAYQQVKVLWSVLFQSFKLELLVGSRKSCALRYWRRPQAARKSAGIDAA